jgi:glucose-1-phosphate thymidylyltransferase
VLPVREAVVLAAGEGRRLRPVTERFAKPVLPIDGRPVLATLLRELASSGIPQVTVVTGYLAEQVEALAGDGSAFGVELRLARQPSPDGSADAVLRALEAGADPPFVICAADTIFTPGDLRRFAHGAEGAAGAIAVRRGSEPSPGKPGIGVESGRVTRVVDPDPAAELTSAPLWMLGAELLPLFESLSGPPFELADVFQRAVDAELPIAGVEIGRTRDLTDALDLVEENFPYLIGAT